MKILDHGYLELVEHWGSDERIIEAARMSTDKGFRGWGPKLTGIFQGEERIEIEHSIPLQAWRMNGKPSTLGVYTDVMEEPGDEKLLAYLWNNKHATPFEMAGLIIEVKAPIFVFREWHRHRTQSYNEKSARYIPLPDENYLPSMERLFLSGGKNKQAGKAEGAGELDESRAQAWLNQLARTYEQLERLYQGGLEWGVPKELARLPLPVARYSKMRASANLRNWLAFLTLRMDKAAQWEIRQYAEAVGSVIKEKFPRTWDLFIEGKQS